MQAVGELDQNHAHIARHGQEHLAEVLGLRLLLALEFDLVELGHAIHELGHHSAELVAYLAFSDRRVLHHVVQQRGRERLRVEVPLGEDLGDFDGMRDVRLAGAPELTLVSGLGELIGRLNLTHVLRLQVGGCIAQKQLGLGHLRSKVGEEARLYQIFRLGGAPSVRAGLKVTSV